MANLWNQHSVPHKGWDLVGVEDIREDGQPESETDYERCMMCGHERIRYVHIVCHEEIAGEFRVGCNCAEKMTGDYVNPQQRERELRNKDSRRLNWIRKSWRESRNGNSYIRVNNQIVTIFSSGSQYGIVTDGEYFPKKYKDVTAAKIAVFNWMEDLKESEEW